MYQLFVKIDSYNFRSYGESGSFHFLVECANRQAYPWKIVQVIAVGWVGAEKALLLFAAQRDLAQRSLEGILKKAVVEAS